MILKAQPSKSLLWNMTTSDELSELITLYTRPHMQQRTFNNRKQQVNLDQMSFVLKKG